MSVHNSNFQFLWVPVGSEVARDEADLKVPKAALEKQLYPLGDMMGFECVVD